MPDDIIKRRLKSLRQREQEKADATVARKANLERRAAENGISVEMQIAIDKPNNFAAVCRPMPLSFYYGEGSTPERDAAFMRRRASFYALCAKVFGFTGWLLESYSHELAIADEAARRGSQKSNLVLIDQEHAALLNTRAAPLEYLVAQNWLETPKDPHGYGVLRWAAAVRFRDEVAGSQAGGLKAQNLEGSGGGFGPRLVSDYALDCIANVSAVRDHLHPGLYRLLHMVVVEDMWVWELDAARADRSKSTRPVGEKLSRKKRAYLEGRRRRLIARRDRIILKLHKAIDGAAVALGYMTDAEYRGRWRPHLKSG